MSDTPRTAAQLADDFHDLHRDGDENAPVGVILAKGYKKLERENADLREDNHKLALHTAAQATELADLRAKLAAAQRDAERYRWLRHNAGYSIRNDLFGSVPMREHKDADLDAFIDDAMQEGK